MGFNDYSDHFLVVHVFMFANNSQQVSVSYIVVTIRCVPTQITMLISCSKSWDLRAYSG